MAKDLSVAGAMVGMPSFAESEETTKRFAHLAELMGTATAIPPDMAERIARRSERWIQNGDAFTRIPVDDERIFRADPRMAPPPWVTEDRRPSRRPGIVVKEPIEKLVTKLIMPKVSEEQVEEAVKIVTKAEHELDLFREALARLTPMESTARGVITKRIEQSDEIVRKHRGQALFARKYRQISEDIFRLRNAHGQPLLIPFLTGRAYFSPDDLSINGGTIIHPTGTVGEFYADCFRPEPLSLSPAIIDSLSIWERTAMAGRPKCHQYTFSGIIPGEVRSHLAGYTREFGEANVLIVADAALCNCVEVEKRDPFVIGYNPEDRRFYLLESFETTDLEEFVREHFTKAK